MDVSIKDVIVKLEELNMLHIKLLDTGQLKKTVLVNNQVNELSLLVSQESKLLKQVTETEAQWRSAIVAFLKDRGIKPDPSFTVTDIIKLVHDARDRLELTKAHDSLLLTIDKLKESNALNQELIEQSLTFINYSIDLYMGGMEQSTIYSNTRQANNEYKKPGLFDRRA